jgi:hypothetical protein
MKKLISIIIVVIIAVGYFYFQRPPKLEGKYAHFHENIWKFTRTADAKEKFLIATRIQLSSALRTLYSNDDSEFSEAEMRAIKEANHLVELSMQKAHDFESHLAVDDIAFIT